MIKAIVFDVDGVILKYNLFSDRYCKRFNLSTETLAPFFEKEFAKSVTGKVDIKKKLKDYLVHWKWDKSIDELMKYWLSEDEIDRGMIQLIRQLNQKGIRTFIGSNQEQYRAEHIRIKLGLKEIVEETFFSCHLRVKKPEAEFFVRIFNEIKKKIKSVKRNEILFIDDTETNTLSAKRIGFKAYHYESFLALKKEIVRYTK